MYYAPCRHPSDSMYSPSLSQDVANMQQLCDHLGFKRQSATAKLQLANSIVRTRLQLVITTKCVVESG